VNHITVHLFKLLNHYAEKINLFTEGFRFLDKPRIVGEGLGAADPDFSDRFLKATNPA
jgi:hypothetical protein